VRNSSASFYGDETEDLMEEGKYTHKKFLIKKQQKKLERGSYHVTVTCGYNEHFLFVFT